jgi:8-oxo-dGTP diphosphatase
MNYSHNMPQSVEQVDWTTHAFTEDAVLCFIRNNDQLLLIHKKTGLGAGKINAPGGRMEKGETAQQCAVRETQEEVGLTPSGLTQVAELNFIFIDGYSLRGFVFFASSHTGEAHSTFEADPFWCRISEIPYKQMWADDAIWLPKVLRDEKVLGRFIFDNDRMLSHEILPLDSFITQVIKAA